MIIISVENSCFIFLWKLSSVALGEKKVQTFSIYLKYNLL